MSQETSDPLYDFYRYTKRLIERGECCDKDHSDDPLLKEFKDAIETLDGFGREYAERYEKEKENAATK